MTYIIKFILTLILTLICQIGYAQSMSVASFYEDEKDLTANSNETMQRDQNGDKCALIKIETTQHNFLFDVGSLGIVKVVNQNADHPSEIWLYVPHGVKKISIQHPQLGKINEYDFGFSLKKAKTYIMKLTSDQVNTMVVDYSNSQYLQFDVFPPDAEVFINGALFKLNDGKFEIPLAFGIHNYRITAPNYHTLDGQVEINDKENKQIFPVRLKQAFGYVDVVDDSREFYGAEVYIDSVHVGSLPISNFSLRSGLHNVYVKKDLYDSFSKNFAVTDSGFVVIPVTMAPNYAEVTISVPSDNDAQIYVDGKLLGENKWTGRLEAGSHTIEAKKISHRTISKEITIFKGQKVRYEMSAPTPIYGVFEGTTTPTEAEVYVDGKMLGKTPYINSRILVGEHTVEFRKKGYKTEIETITIEEGKTNRVTRMLTDYCNATLSSTPQDARVFIDDEYKGNTPYRLNLVAGSYKIDVKSRGYSDYSKTMKLNGATEDILIKLHRNYTRKNEFYMQLGFNPFLASAINFGVGFYINNYNFETSCMIGLVNDEKIYWTEEEECPVAAIYKPSVWDLKFGYGIRLSSRVRITPQIGTHYLGLKETIEEIEYAGTDYYIPPSTVADGANAVSMTIGSRFNIALSPCIGVSLTPEYMIPIFKSDGYKVLSNTSDKINGFVSGFSGLINLNLYF